MEYDSQIISLAEITRKKENWSFSVPIYQRLYVWGNDEVNPIVA